MTLNLVKNHVLKQNILYAAHAYRVPCPVGDVVVIVTEENEKPIFIQIFIGKPGTEVRANAYALESLSNELIKEVNGFNRLMLHLCNISTDRSVMLTMYKKCRSLPEALYIALDKYRTMRSNNANRFNKQEIKPRLARINIDRARNRTKRNIV